MPPKQISIVIPINNEEGILSASIAEIASGIRGKKLSAEILIVENGSTDNTVTIARQLAEKYPEVTLLQAPEPDYGVALKKGLLAASGEIGILFDIDFYDLDFIDRARTEIENGADIVIATKRGAGSQDRRAPIRRIVTAGFTTILKIGFGLKSGDTHGIKAMRMARIRPILEASTARRDLYDTEVVLRAERAGCKITQVPIVVEEQRPARISIARRALRTIFDLLKLRIRLWRS